MVVLSIPSLCKFKLLTSTLRQKIHGFSHLAENYLTLQSNGKYDGAHFYVRHKYVDQSELMGSIASAIHTRGCMIQEN